jgi:hypothetical protein
MIFELRSQMLDEKPVTLNNTYRGIPVHHRGVIRMVNQDYLALDIHPEQYVCLQKQKSTVITGKHLKFPVKAQLVNLDMKYCNAVFSSPLPLAEKIEKWTTPCLTPEEDITCDVGMSEKRFNAQVLDFTLPGKHSCTIHLSSQERLPLDLKAEAILTVSFPSATIPGAAPARLQQVYRVSGNHPAWRYRFMFPLEEPAAKPVKDYLSSLKKEIQQDLKERADQIRQKKL